jgi:16S rRNA (cytosine1402-N4)-methyltransferase
MAPGRERGDLSHLHRPVLVREVLEHLAPSDHIGDAGTGAILVVDGTVGLGGHAEAMLRAWPSARLIGLDRDLAALTLCKERLAAFPGRARLFHASYADLAEALSEAGEGRPDRVLLDLGVSSLQLDEGARGFSFRAPDAAADMRFDPDGGGATAADLVNRLPEAELARVLFEHGDERRSRAIAKALVRARPVRTVGDLLDAVRTATRGGREASGLHPATRTFQALRIAVNDEAGHLKRGLDAALSCAAAGGRVAAISFHSGEDRAVKEAFRAAQEGGRARVVTAKPVRPTEQEVAENARAAPARLRVAEVTGAGDGGGTGRRART